MLEEEELVGTNIGDDVGPSVDIGIGSGVRNVFWAGDEIVV